MKVSVENGVVSGVAGNLQDVKVLLTLQSEPQKGERKSRKVEPFPQHLSEKILGLEIGDFVFISSKETNCPEKSLTNFLVYWGKKNNCKFGKKQTDGGWNVKRKA